MTTLYKEVMKTSFWIDRPEIRNQRSREIHAEVHKCPQCMRRMYWSSDHVNFIYFECSDKDCGGEKKVYL
ncbi:hypothetical protein [Bacillus cereus]|uniref:hypothetical protein n=1 Tax=Bacillus cereus TaxID=1396 RepID=UPI00397FE76F